MFREARQQAWNELKSAWADCRDCRLCQHRHTIVMGEGSLSPLWMFIGEGPGQDEDFTGRPFVGKSGQLLRRSLDAIPRRRRSVLGCSFITNTVACWPPGNRNPRDDEMGACLPRLAATIELLRPTKIVLVGGVAIEALFSEDTALFQNRRKWRSLKLGDLDIPVTTIYHPAYALRNPNKKMEFIEDLDFAIKSQI